MSFSALRSQRGFTLIELLLVIGIIAILASIVIVAINPTKQLGNARDAQRRSDVNTILNGVYQYAIDHNGNLPSGIPTGTAKIICQSTMTSAACTTLGGVNLSVLTGSYLVSVPKDPLVTATATGTNYYIVQDANGRITVSAPNAEQTAAITVTR
jgi:prepilin-type N-terminal cleavage/methylation domain-containing protein